MPANNSKWQVHYWQGLYGGLGHLYSPGQSGNTYPHLPYALDNGAFPAFTNKTEWDEAEWYRLLKWAAAKDKSPIFVLVPDVVMDKQATIDRYPHYREEIKKIMPYAKIAFCMQDGMTHLDIPQDADFAFIGGSTEYKWRIADDICHRMPTHIGRVNSFDRLVYAHDIGAVSVDGTGWFRGSAEQLRGLERFLRMQHRENSQPYSVVQDRTLYGNGTKSKTMFLSDQPVFFQQ